MENRMSVIDHDIRNVSGLDQLQSHLQSRLLGKVRGFELIIQDRGLILRGQSRTYYAKQLAQHAVMDATDRVIVANEIKVF